jgi:hypothetical protein
MSETPQEAQAGVTGAVRDLPENPRALVRHEIAAVQKEMLGNVKQALPAAGLLGAAAIFGVLSAAASFRLSVRLLEKSLPPATAALTAAAGYAVAAGAAGAVGIRQLRAAPPGLPTEKARETVKTAASTAKTAATRAKTTATRAKTTPGQAKTAASKATASRAKAAKATADKPARAATR